MKTNTNPMTETHVNIVLGGCGHSTKSMEFSALVVTGCIIGAMLMIAVASFLR